MSRSNPRSSGSSSPVKTYLSFSGKTGKVVFYDKAAKEDVELDELDIVLLDRRASITGWDDDAEKQIYSNSVGNITSEELEVKSKGLIAKGLYKDIKDKVADKGGKYTANLYCLANIDGEWVMANLQLTGSGLSEWMNFEEATSDVYNHVITVTGGDKRKKGAVKYVVPAFEAKDLPDKLAVKATESDVVLQKYFSGAKEEEGSSRTDKVSESKSESKTEGKAKAKKVPLHEEEDEDDEDDVPFK